MVSSHTLPYTGEQIEEILTSLSVPDNKTLTLTKDNIIADGNLEVTGELKINGDELVTKSSVEEIVNEAVKDLDVEVSVDEIINQITPDSIGAAASAHSHDYADRLHGHSCEDISGVAHEGHDHDERYALSQHIHEEYSNKTHEHTEYVKKSEIPTKVSAFANDAGYLTEHIDISGKADKNHTHSDYAASNHTHTASNITDLSNVISNTVIRGYYIGTGDSGPDNPTEIVGFKSPVKYLIILPGLASNNSTTTVHPAYTNHTQGYASYSTSIQNYPWGTPLQLFGKNYKMDIVGDYDITVTQFDTTVQWYASNSFGKGDDESQYNVSGVRYEYIAFM